jgi:beta-galactosidase
VHDFGFVFVDGKRAGIFDRRHPVAKMALPDRKSAGQLDILVEPMGRINFGEEIADRKGLTGPVTLDKQILKNWEVFCVPLEDKIPASLKFTDQGALSNTPAFWRGTFNLAKTGDTFLDLSGWGKGDVWVNGHCLGRYWNIGPSQTAYAPGCWLRSGENEIVILDFTGPKNAVVAGLEKPILSELHPENELNPGGSKSSAGR